MGEDRHTDAVGELFIISIAYNDNKREVIDEELVYKALIEIG